MAVRCYRRVHTAAVAAALIVAVALAGPSSGAEAAASFAKSFAAGPVNAGNLNYLSLSLGPGGSESAAIHVANLQNASQTLELYAVRGVTSPPSGDAYVGSPGSCAHAGCWVTRLIKRVTLSGGSSQDVSFTVQVPAGTDAGQYLAGVAVEPVVTAKPSGGGSPGVRSVVHTQVVIGVAVTVGSGYPSILSIPGVVGAAIGDQPGVAVTEENGGAQFEHPRGMVILKTSSGDRSFPLRSNTVLPGDEATLRVAVSGVKPGVYASEAWLRYDSGAKTTYWFGTVTVPVVNQTPTVPVSSSGKILGVIPHPSILEIVAAFGAGVLVVMAMFLLTWWWRRRRSKDDESVEGKEPLSFAAQVTDVPTRARPRHSRADARRSNRGRQARHLPSRRPGRVQRRHGR